MSTQNNPSSQQTIADLLRQLNQLGVTPEQISESCVPGLEKPRRTRRSAAKKKPPAHQCIARIWKSEPTEDYPKGRPGYGSRCTKTANCGDFCKTHGKPSTKKTPCPDKKCAKFGEFHEFTWEHCGRYDEPCPKFFNSSVWATCWIAKGESDSELRDTPVEKPDSSIEEAEPVTPEEKPEKPAEQLRQELPNQESTEETMQLLFGDTEEDNNATQPPHEEDEDEPELEPEDDDEPELEPDEDDDEPELEPDEDDDEPGLEPDEDDDEPELEPDEDDE